MDTPFSELKSWLNSELSELKGFLAKNSKVTVSEKWIPRSEVMKFLNYRATQMAALEKSGDLVITKVGKRIFIHRDSLAKMLDKNIISKP